MEAQYCGVWCVVCGVWCVVCGVWALDVQKEGGKDEDKKEKKTWIADKGVGKGGVAIDVAV